MRASARAAVLFRALCPWIISPGISTHFEDCGRVTGWWTAAFFLGQFLTRILMGVLAGVTVSLTVAVGVVGIAAAVVAALVGMSLRRAPEAPVAA